MSKGEVMASYIFYIQCGGNVQKFSDKYGDYDTLVKSCDSWYKTSGKPWAVVPVLVAEYHRFCGAGW